MADSDRTLRFAWVVLGVLAVTAAAAGGSGDINNDGFVGLVDFVGFRACLLSSGPGVGPAYPVCLESCDADRDGDVDLADLGAFVRAIGHLPIPLRDSLGNVITVDSTAPYSGRATCGSGGCHDVDRITNGFLFQQGRTDTAGNLDMQDDHYGDGRWWIKSSGRYGRWGQSFKYLLAAKENAHASDMEQTTFAWIRDCGGCHPGGGPGEFDRNGQLLYDEVTGKFGYEEIGQTADDVTLDGDYSVLDYSTGTVRPAPWDVTGLSGPDCLWCHRTQRTVVDGVDMNHAWRKSVLAAGDGLTDNNGQPVPAFAAAATAGQGWFSTMVSAGAEAASKGGRAPSADGRATAKGGRVTPRKRSVDPTDSVASPACFGDYDSTAEGRAAATTLQIDYAVGVGDGSLHADNSGALSLTPRSVTRPPLDQACWACHPFSTITGTVWFDESNVHYRKFNNLNDEDPNNDIPPENSKVCTVCHQGDLDHNFGRGNSFQVQYRNDLDWHNMRNCRSCHLTLLPNGQPNTAKHPDAPDVPGELIIHIKMEPPKDFMSCQGCHIPYSLAPAVLFRDITIPGAIGTTTQYLSADPLQPSHPDKSRWYPGLGWKEDFDGVMRLFPVNYWIMIYWADWDQKGTPHDLSDDIISPIYTWRINQLIPEPLDIVTDDNADGQLEINRPQEILAYIQALKGTDSNGRQVAKNPVLVKGPRVWYEDPNAWCGVSFFEPEGTGIPMTWYPYIWGKDHNVRPKEEAWGYSEDHGPAGCRHCHQPDVFQAPVFDRLILVDPYGTDGQPVYKTVREMTGANPP